MFLRTTLVFLAIITSSMSFAESDFEQKIKAKKIANINIETVSYKELLEIFENKKDVDIYLNRQEAYDLVVTKDDHLAE